MRDVNDGLAVKPDEVTKLNGFFKQKFNGIPSIVIEEKKYQVSHYEPNIFTYIKSKEVGATIDKTNQTYIIGVFCTSKNYLYDQKNNFHKTLVYAS